MTAGGAAPARGKRPWLWVLLALSLTLNLFFVAGAAWIRMHRAERFPNAVARMRYMAAELHLDATHQEAFERYLRMLRARLHLMHSEVRPLVNEAWAELAKPQANEEEVMRLFDEAAAKHRQFQQELARSTLAFLATLSPEQRQKFVALARRGPRTRARPLFHHPAPSPPAKPAARQEP